MKKIIIFIITGVLLVSMANTKKLSSYKSKRNFAQTPEPTGARKVKKNELLFVVQLHHASHKHYDFRLNIDGTLTSWAIPKGPSYNPKDKRLAIRTEDHPLDYAYFEGIIPAGNYGAGSVMVWDIGSYKNMKKTSMVQNLKDGRIEIMLHGKKLEGGFALIRFKVDDDKEYWLFKKIDDEYASAKKNPVTTQKKSVLSHRSMAQIAKDLTR